MQLTELSPPDDLAARLAAFEAAGGVVEYVLLTSRIADQTEDDVHTAAAIGTLDALRRRHAPVWPIEVEGTRACGERVDLGTFIGPRYDLATGRLLMRGASPNYLNHYFWVGDRQNWANAVALVGNAEEGYAYAFTAPPHGLTHSNEEVNGLFNGLNDRLVGGLSANLVIYRWSTNWSTYFEPGHEWWGSFLWTVHNPVTGTIVGIAASTTD